MSPAVIFDFDFTLVDSSRGFIETHTWTAAQIGLPAPDPHAVVRSIGTPLPGAFRMIYGDEQAAVADKYIELYQAKADEVMTPGTVLLAPSRAAVAELRAQGLSLAIVSQKLRRRVLEVLDREQITASFETVIGGEDLTRLKPDPEGLRLALDRLGSPPAIYVGDTTIDAEAAANAGLRFVAVLTGVTTREEFAAHPSIAVLDSVAGLPELCRGLSW